AAPFDSNASAEVLQSQKALRTILEKPAFIAADFLINQKIADDTLDAVSQKSQLALLIQENQEAAETQNLAGEQTTVIEDSLEAKGYHLLTLSQADLLERPEIIETEISKKLE